MKNLTFMKKIALLALLCVYCEPVQALKAEKNLKMEKKRSLKIDLMLKDENGYRVKPDVAEKRLGEYYGASRNSSDYVRFLLKSGVCLAVSIGVPCFYVWISMQSAQLNNLYN